MLLLGLTLDIFISKSFILEINQVMEILSVLSKITQLLNVKIKLTSRSPCFYLLFFL